MTTSWRNEHLLAVVPHGRATDLLMSENTWRDVGGIVSIADPYAGKRPPRTGFDRVPYRLSLSFDDVESPTHDYYVPPDLNDVRQLLAFGSKYDADAASLSVAEKRLVVHCHAGVSRSTAAALAIVAQRLGPGMEEAAMQLVAVCTESGRCDPNALIVRYADELLERDGALVRAVATHAGWVAAAKGPYG